jgi:hypothetical protein
VVFDAISGEPSDNDILIHKHYGEFYTVVDIPAQDHRLTPPNGISGFDIPEPVYLEGHCITGHAQLLIVITAAGAVKLPYVTAASGGPFASLATQRVNKWRFRPAMLNGNSIPTVNVAHVGFHCPVELNAISGLWQFQDKAVWIDLRQDGWAFECRMGRGQVFASKGTFKQPYSIVWDKYWGTEPLDYSDETLFVNSRGGDLQFRRVPGPMSAECVHAYEHGS